MQWIVVIIFFAAWTVPAKIIFRLYGEIMLRVCFRNKIHFSKVGGVLLSLTTQIVMFACAFICLLICIVFPFAQVMKLSEINLLFVCYSCFWCFFLNAVFVCQNFGEKYGVILSLSGETMVDPDDSSPGKEASRIAFEYHVKEFKSLKAKTREEIATRINIVVKNCSNSKKISGGRTVYWEKHSKIIVIVDPASVDKGTAFRLIDGENYFNSLR